MRRRLRPLELGPIAAALLIVVSLACSSIPNPLEPSAIVPSQPPPPTAPLTESTAQSTAVGTLATAAPTEAPSPVPVKTSNGPDSAAPARDPCGLPGVQVRANFFSAVSTNALMAPFSGDVKILNTAGGPNIFSMQQASVQRKFVIIIKNLKLSVYDLKSTYMSYTEKTSSTDKTPKIWKATSGFLQILECDGGGLALRTASDPTAAAGDSVLFEPLKANNNPAAGDMLIGVGARIQ